MAMVMHIPPFPGMDAELQKQCCKYVLKVADKYPGFQLERREEFEEGTANLSNIDWAFRRITQAYNKMQVSE